MHLIEILQHPQRDAAIDDIFALIACIIPAAGHVQRIGAARPVGARLIEPLEAGHDLADMPRRARPLGAPGETRIDRHPGALLVEEIERGARQRAIDIGRNSEGVAGAAIDLQAIGARRAERAEVDLLHLVARGGIGAEDRGIALRNRAALLVEQFPGRGRAVFRDDGMLGGVGAEADLVEMRSRRFPRGGRRQREQGKDHPRHNSGPLACTVPLVRVKSNPSCPPRAAVMAGASGEGAVMRRKSPWLGIRAAVSA